MNESRTSVISARPVPVFENAVEGLFSTKKARAQTERKYRPPPPPHPARVRSTLSRRRVRSCLPEAGAVAVSFRDHSDSSVLTNSLYNTADQLTYLDQCFDEKRLIGSGCFGEVFSARSRIDGRMYAIKKSRQRFRSDADRRRRLEEVRKHERLPPHRHCVAFHGAWEERDHLYLQTELCATSLADVADTEHSIPESTVWAYMVDLLLAIKHLHDNQLVHLDIKPENIFVMREGYCKLGDFGLVMDLSGSRDLDDSDAMEGDPKYMAPELMTGRFSAAADVFSLGLTLLELACDLELPAGAAGWHQLRSGQVPAPLRRTLSPALRHVLERMLHPDPARRATAAELLRLPAVRAARRKRQLTILCCTAPAPVAGTTDGPTPQSNGTPAAWLEPAYSDDEDPLNMTGDSLQSELGLLSSTPERVPGSAASAARHQMSLRRVLLFNDDQDEAEDPVPVPAAPPSGRRLRRPAGGATGGGGDSSPVSRRRHMPRPRALGSLRGVQQKLDFQAARLSDDD
ncbi:membrane-associated tyrosine- and threonine-specific cdc2-inhibitory kinase-like isoform X3 [Amphibalanus amphitrite]|uniref:membrane-associated tyrosine- and threonine-specific cdc2-inhibitory kinase-like isoform X2 n=1 Tax=Amphibalanus amphitrite TaxID=1232801 RepID=UPI001C924F8A|nr:membrane-associated tyrosine- and threonine-specific cdc2-inhibitory kinase-like isoform X2 [Amphibalanus amphitrite]XP_043238059.1 membrane-associated tyrosine- and threonine-specific cdc2-inhibitory kinase-like isoform X2 [Amphibalanus amphitrite]XP_043244229.1 membrane-associated tyrosine- and threonine-specific cdc2-inhibitory kinase-like isoform X3 [Amphibalanus amphitrite]XP_043244230.1 membrane-associated tyrosine- and threonine-specific cdc2-inhibitory kinase-like isoform X3 [Amphibal